TGHAWDGDLQEFNNPLPTWWLWAFYATVVFAIIYWILYPTLPIGDTYTKGVMNDITYTTEDGKTVTTHWNTRALFEKEMQEAREAQAKYVEEVSQASYQQIQANPEISGFVLSRAKVLFADNCAACHQTGGNGVIGKYPNLIDDAWLWGGSYEKIQQTIINGRNGNMPSFKKQFSDEQIEDVATYVLSLSGHDVDQTIAAKGKKIFSANCAVCHGQDAKGQHAMGSANLTDSIWTIANVPGADSIEKKKDAIMHLVRNGKARHMPAWKDRLSDTEIKILTYYVHEMGGGN
ncbi:MAG: cytochrome-c oxidase, cbb3-type subunit III, partial [Thiohalophilus sp.]